MASLPYTASGNTLTIFTEDVITISSSHPNFTKLLEALRGPQASSQVPDLLDPLKALSAFTGGRIHARSGRGRIEMAEAVLDAGYPRMAEALNAFLDASPSFLSMGVGNPILADGCFLMKAYGRGVRACNPGGDGSTTHEDLNIDLANLDPADRIVLEQIQSIGWGEDTVFFVTSYRTLVVPQVRMPFMPPGTPFEITDLSRNIKVPGVTVGIEFIRSVANV